MSNASAGHANQGSPRTATESPMRSGLTCGQRQQEERTALPWPIKPQRTTEDQLETHPHVDAASVNLGRLHPKVTCRSPPAPDPVRAAGPSQSCTRSRSQSPPTTLSNRDRQSPGLPGQRSPCVPGPGHDVRCSTTSCTSVPGDESRLADERRPRFPGPSRGYPAFQLAPNGVPGSPPARPRNRLPTTRAEP